ncbi:MAG: hypothetical protein ACE5HZ_07965, partial [Fidelibacterota bacterium]
RNHDIRGGRKIKSLLGDVLLVAGGALTVAGLVESNGVEFIVGGGCLVAGYLLKTRGKNLIPVPGL